MKPRGPREYTLDLKKGQTVLLTSGVTPFPSIDGVTLLKKPYFLVDLEREIRALLRRAGAAGFGGRAVGRPAIPGEP